MPDQNSTTRLIPLTQGQFAIVDADDFERVNCFKWSAQPRGGNKWYARSTSSIDGQRTLLHRFILGLKDTTVQVDHRDRNGLNNTKSNLRLCTSTQNHGNASKLRKDGITSKYRGVSIITGKNKWRAGILALGRRRDLGTYTSEVDAAHAYDAAAVKFFGEFANTNFPYVPPNLRVEVYDPLKELQEIADDLAADGDCIACLKTEAAIEALRPCFPPASTARTDGPKYKHKANCLWATPLPTGAGFWGCDCGLDKLLLDLEDYEVAAPGSVPQAPDQSAALRTALEALAQDYKEEARNAETSFAYMNAMEVLGVPQAGITTAGEMRARIAAATDEEMQPLRDALRIAVDHFGSDDSEQAGVPQAEPPKEEK